MFVLSQLFLSGLSTFWLTFYAKLQNWPNIVLILYNAKPLKWNFTTLDFDCHIYYVIKKRNFVCSKYYHCVCTKYCDYLLMSK